MIAPPSVLQNSTVAVTVKVCNQGDSGGQAAVALYRSTDATITLADTFIGSTSTTGFLLPGACNLVAVSGPIPGPQGTFYLGGYADPYNALVEANESNNAAAPPNATVVGSKPDFIITSVSGPNSATQSSSFSVTTMLCNQGTQSGSAPVGIYLSADNTITTSDFQVGQFSAPSLAPGACTPLTGNVTASVSAGAYWLGAIADRSNAVSELIETNNALAGNQMGVGSKPDLVVTAVSGPAIAVPGASLQMTATLCNQGTQPGTAPVTLYFSTDGTITTADIQVGLLSAPPSLAPGACATLTGTATASGASGVYWLGAIADRAGTVSELIETNNAKAGNRIGTGNAPDFSVTSVSTAPGVSPGAPVTVAATVCNQGTAPGNAAVGILFSWDDTITPSDWFAGVLPAMPFLLPGACDVVSGTLSGPTIQTAYNVGAIADFYNATAELFEDNNAKAGNRVGVGNAPDLVVSSVSSAPSALPGSQVTVTATVCNQGTMGASGKATLYFSSDATITTGDLLGGDFNPSPFLLPGDCDTGSLTLPAPPPGVYTVGAIVDRFALTAELLEDNNATAGNQLAVGNKPDFIVSSVSAPTSALPGGPLQVTATVCNQGTLGTSVTVMEVFFSTDATITASDLLGGSFPPAPFLDAGACATLSANVPAPPSGTYYAGAIADRPGIVPELIETNNATAGNRLAVGNGADFVISSLSAGVAAFPGGSVQVAVTVCNQGTLGASAPVDLYFSTDAFISNNDFYSTGMGAPYLGPGACASMTANAWAPSAAGTYFIGAIADQFNGAPELFEDNNTRAGNRVGVGNSPDFSVQAVSAAPSAMPGSPVTVTATLCNQGTIPGSAPAAVYFSTDATITIGDLFGGFLPPLPFLMPGACDVVTGTVPAPTVGTYRVGVIVDPYVSMLELFEDNNALAGNRVAVGNGPDFIISAVSTAASALPGAMAQVTATVCNQGTMGANAPVVELYFSTDATITGTDFFAGILANAPFLEPGACATQTQGSPLPGSAGTWYAGAIADRPNSIPELLEDNNALAGSRIAVGNGPDFVVSSVTSAGGVFPNGSMQVTATVCNQGTQGASVPFVEVFFSTDATITGEDSFGGTLPPSPYLNPGDCAPLSGNVMAPPIPGAYYAGAIVDRFQWVSELLEDNNAKAGNRVGVGNLPDFVVSSVSTAVTAYPGGMLEVTATVCNQGTQSGGAPLDIYFSTDTFVSMNDYYASSLPMPWLEAGACATVTGNTWAPSQDGTYYIGAIADQYGGMPELFEDNNTRAGNRVGVGNAPDFYVKAVSAPASALPGSPVTVTATICNQGTLPGSAPVGVYFSTDAAITTVDFLGGFLPPIPFLLPGSCEVVSGTFPAPPAGTYWAGVIADPYGSTQELFEDNNALAGNRVGVGSGPDFVISSVSTAPSALPGAQVTINATVCNQGTVGGSTPVDLYFSTDATITTMDQPAWSFPPDAYLKPGECTTKTASVGAPPGGTWWVGAIADAWNSNPELFDDNNAKAGNRLVVGNGPDFVVASMHATPSAIPGGMTSVTATVCNQGTQGASVPMVEVFFSTDTAITDKDFLGGPLPPGPAPYLEAGACAELTGSAMVPYTPGAYFAGAIIDRFQWVSELLEDNNTTAGGRIGVGNLPDYIISSVSTGVTVLPGGMLEVTVTACNQGTTGGSVPLDVYFSTDSSISTNDYHASSLPMPWLEAGACATMTGTTWAPSQEGTYYVGAIVDQFGGMPELFKDNNVRAGNQVGVGNLPDFYLKSVSTAPSALPGAPLEVAAMVCNQGTTGGSAPVAVYFSTDGDISNTDFLAGYLPPIPWLVPGMCDVVTGTFPAPPQGSYQVGAIVDDSNSIPELFEGNNALAGSRVGVGSAPDFIISSVSTAPSAFPGAQITVSATLCNQGTVPGSAPVDFFFSSDATITTMDPIVWGFPPDTFLQPGECVTKSAAVGAPPVGTWWVGAIADAWGSNPELFEDNNAGAAQRIAVGYGSNFVISSVSTAPSAMPGAMVTVTATVCNQGTVGDGVPMVEVFFSTDATITGGDFLAGTLPPMGAPYLEPGTCATLAGPVMVPPLPGTYTVGAIADPLGWTPELFEDDNAAAGNRVGVGNLPDFIISSVSTVAAVSPGWTLEVTATVCNQGSMAGSAPLDIYFSTDSYISINDYHAVWLPMPWLEAGACATVTGMTTAPSQPGTYYIGAIADLSGGMPELFKDNNTRAGNRVGVGDAPDFSLSAVSTAASVTPGGQLTVTATICNQGTSPGSAPVTVVFSMDATITQMDFFAGMLPPIAFLTPGTCEVASGTFPAPPNGTWWVGAIADQYNSTSELFEDNNVKAGNRVGVGDQPDFVISSVSTAPSALPGAPVDVTVTLCNQGTVPGSAPVDLYFSTDATITTMDLIAWGFPPMTYLEPGACTTQSAMVGAPPTGTYWVGAIADSYNSMMELFDDNNATAGNRLVIGNGPDFTVTSVSADPSALPGSMVSVTATLCNQGTQGASAPMVEVYFSTDTTITAGDSLGGAFPPPPFLEAGACATLAGTAMVPSNSGTYYVGTIADRFGFMPELLEDNNATAGGRIGVGNAPDLFVSSVSTAVSSAFPSDALDVSVTVCNQGTMGGIAPLNIYFSTDTSITPGDYYGSWMPMSFLNPGACATMTGTVFAPYQSGTYYVGAIIDQFGGMPDLFKDNNTRAGNRIGVGYAPDLVVTSVSGPASALPWSPITVTATVCNQGTTANEAGQIDVLLSTDSTIAPQDFYAGSLPPAGFLQPGACATVSGTVNAAGPGSYTLGAIVDRWNWIFELIEDNNAAAGGTLVLGP